MKAKPKPKPATLGQRIEARRKSLGLARQACADSAGVSHNTWYRWERGMDLPVSILDRIAAVLDTTARDLLP